MVRLVLVPPIDLEHKFPRVSRPRVVLACVLEPIQRILKLLRPVVEQRITRGVGHDAIGRVFFDGHENERTLVAGEVLHPRLVHERRHIVVVVLNGRAERAGKHVQSRLQIEDEFRVQTVDLDPAFDASDPLDKVDCFLGLTLIEPFPERPAAKPMRADSIPHGQKRVVLVLANDDVIRMVGDELFALAIAPVELAIKGQDKILEAPRFKHGHMSQPAELKRCSVLSCALNSRKKMLRRLQHRFELRRRDMLGISVILIVGYRHGVAVRIATERDFVLSAPDGLADLMLDLRACVHSITLLFEYSVQAGVDVSRGLVSQLSHRERTRYPKVIAYRRSHETCELSIPTWRRGSTTIRRADVQAVRKNSLRAAHRRLPGSSIRLQQRGESSVTSCSGTRDALGCNGQISGSLDAERREGLRGVITDAWIHRIL
ncbi:hypothetical protein L810_0460 [Burkholderia sp. AU4i]|nr:hypothetical protein L810_0460 [Burkholderia sp. AU4i]